MLLEIIVGIFSFSVESTDFPLDTRADLLYSVCRNLLWPFLIDIYSLTIYRPNAV